MKRAVFFKFSSFSCFRRDDFLSVEVYFVIKLKKPFVIAGPLHVNILDVAF